MHTVLVTPQQHVPSPLGGEVAVRQIATKTKLAPAVRVPSTMKDALKVFWFKHAGPPLVVLSLAALTTFRLSLPQALSIGDAIAGGSTIVGWWFQEHFLHKYVLHSEVDWIGKTIHEEHHSAPYHHISMEPATLIMGWLGVAHVLFRVALPLPLALSATFGYACSGLAYMWNHYIVHTKVRFAKGSYLDRVKAHHIRHHQLDHRYWLGFTYTGVDDFFGTNPSVQEVRRQRSQ